ncbi:uncharacterized protein LOC103381295 isoform X2 [Cynoglossus semilaevis]|uniref:uncharacterized protein LOC103381295 isoform X2 n=1 Tax=Cynoglossus semilaevis TaxID=244447 RepID=UPI000D626B4E|nr:uncharacterized protein LOC103381295 isoform X2 [Cynoglossus semilaevis]
MRVLVLVFWTVRLQITADRLTSVVVKEGESVVLPCDTGIPSAHGRCNTTYWIVSSTPYNYPVSDGKVIKQLSEKLSLTDDCSLLMKKVTTSDSGRYYCRQDSSGHNDALVYLSTVRLSEQKEVDGVTLTCAVTVGDHPNLRVECGSVDGTDSWTSQFQCSIRFPSSVLHNNPDYRRLFVCNVSSKLRDEDAQTFTFRIPSTDETQSLKLMVRDGGHVSLPCKALLSPDEDADADWFFTADPSSPEVKLLSRREKTNNDRPELSVTQEFSLVLEKVTVKDFGQYTCRINQPARSSLVQLSVINIYAVDDTKLACSVLSFKACGHSVEWLIKGAEGQVSQDGCSAQLTFTTPLTNHHGCFTCRVNDSSNVALYYFGPPSCEGAVSAPVLQDPHWWIYLAVAVAVGVGVTVILLTAIIVVCQRKHKGLRPQTDNVTETVPVTTSPTATSHSTQDLEDGICYASVSYTQRAKTKEKTHMMIERDDVDDDVNTVTYSAVKTFSSRDNAPDSGSLYASAKC